MYLGSSGSWFFFVDVFNKFWGSYHIPMLMIISLIIIYKSNSKLSKKVFLYPFIVCMLTIYNPFLMYWVMKLLDISERYYRFYWLTPFALIIGIAITDYYVGNVKDRVKALKIFAIFLVILSLTGSQNTFVINKISDINVYGISEENIELSNIIRNDKGDDEETIIFSDTNIVYTLRIYDASLLPVVSRYEDTKFLYGSDKEAAQEMLYECCEEGRSYILIANWNVEYDAEIVKADLAKAGVEYFIRNKSWYSDEYMKELGYALIGETANYQVYKVI